MRKLLFSFLSGVFFLFSTEIGKAVDIPGNLAKPNLLNEKVTKPVIQTFSIFSDSLNANVDAIPHKKHRFIAALLAFPLGIFGLHRLYLGTSGQIPFIYIVTFGGVFGVLPFIDFVLILLSKDKEFHTNYTGNHHLFLWQKDRNNLPDK